jgi:hypothetical protein
MSQIIQEATIDEVLDRLSPTEAEGYQSVLEQNQNRQPGIFSYLTAESFDILTDDEKAFMIYLALVILEAVYAKTEPELISPQDLEKADERNWELWGEASGKRFRERLDVFFEDSEQEDLLAFVEDSISLEQDEENEWGLTNEGREPLFIGLKTVVDCLLPASNSARG